MSKIKRFRILLVFAFLSIGCSLLADVDSIRVDVGPPGRDRDISFTVFGYYRCGNYDVKEVTFGHAGDTFLVDIYSSFPELGCLASLELYEYTDTVGSLDTGWYFVRAAQSYRVTYPDGELRRSELLDSFYVCNRASVESALDSTAGELDTNGVR